MYNRRDPKNYREHRKHPRNDTLVGNGLPSSRRNTLPHPPVHRPFPTAPPRRRSEPITGHLGLPNRLASSSRCGSASIPQYADGTPTRHVHRFGWPRRSGRWDLLCFRFCAATPIVGPFPCVTMCRQLALVVCNILVFPSCRWARF